MQTILVPLDGSPFSEQALPLALTLARRARAALALAHVHRLQPTGIAVGGEILFDPTINAAFREQAREYLEGLAQRVSAVWGGTVTVALLDEPVVPALVGHAQSVDADLIVMSTHGRGGLSRLWLGSTVDKLVRQMSRPILALRPHDSAPELAAERQIAHILIPIDGSALAEEAIGLAERVGRLTGARYTLVQVIDPSVRAPVLNGSPLYIETQSLDVELQQAQEYLEALAASLRARGAAVDVEAPVGGPAATILRLISERRADLVALTTHGRGGLSRLFLGSVADKVLRGAGVPVLIQHPAEADLPADI